MVSVTGHALAQLPPFRAERLKGIGTVDHLYFDISEGHLRCAGLGEKANVAGRKELAGSQLNLSRRPRVFSQ